MGQSLKLGDVVCISSLCVYVWIICMGGVLGRKERWCIGRLLDCYYCLDTGLLSVRFVGNHCCTSAIHSAYCTGFRMFVFYGQPVYFFPNVPSAVMTFRARLKFEI